jgi:hypothetical protein
MRQSSVGSNSMTYIIPIVVLLFLVAVLSKSSRKASDTVIYDGEASGLIVSHADLPLPKQNPLSRLEEYCTRKSRTGIEGSYFDGRDNFKMTNLVITIRHGDRSNINIIPNSDGAVKATNSNVDQADGDKVRKLELLSPDVLQYTKFMNAFELNLVGPPPAEPTVSLSTSYFNDLLHRVVNITSRLRTCHLL